MLALFWALLLSVEDGGNPRWLAIGGSDRTVSAALRTQAGLRGEWPQVTIVASDDCEGMTAGLFLTVVAEAEDRGAASEAVKRVTTAVPGAYLKQCRPKPGSRAGLGLPVIDSSIEKVPDTVVNWTEGHRVSRVVALPEKGFLWIRKYYADEAREDPREGRREALALVAGRGAAPVVLSEDCASRSYGQRSGWIVAACERAVAGDHTLHETTVFDGATGHVVFKVGECRTPALVSNTELSCEAESVNGVGRLILKRKRVAFR